MAKNDSLQKDEQTQPGVAIMAIAPENSHVLPEIIKENFGNVGLRLNDLDRIKIPGSGGTAWSIPSIMEADDISVKEMVGVIVGWSDKKAWWAKAFDDPNGGGGSQPDCKSEDMMHGLGDPRIEINNKELALINDGKAHNEPHKDAEGFLCSTCVHNVFGSAAKGEGKACKDMRFIIMLTKDQVLPVLIRIPPTSLLPMKNYFKRLAGNGKRYYGVITALTLTKERTDSKIEYSTVVPRAVRFLNDEEMSGAKSYHDLMQPMLDNNAVEAGLAEKGEDVTPASDSHDAAMTDQQDI